MEINTILTLINAGYSKAEIEAMTGAEDTPKEQPKEEQPKEQQNEQGAAEQPKENENISELTKQIMALSEVVKGLQTQNAKRAESAPPEKMGAEGAIKSFFGVK